MTRPLRVAVDLYDLHRWFGDDYREVIEIARIADEVGVDEINVTDHVIMGEAVEQYPYGTFRPPLDYPWFEPFVTLAAIAGATSRIGLTTGVAIAPLRPAVLLAKQLASLDVLSRGRLSVGVGVGWQKAEYDASGVAWDGRYARLEEQLRVCRLLWREAPASFQGETVRFDRMHAYPRPFRRAAVPIWFGLAPTERNCRRIAELGDGWVPIVQQPEEIAAGVAAIGAAFALAGRDVASLGVRVMPPLAFGRNGRPDLGATLARVPALHEAGATVIVGIPSMFCSGPGEVRDFMIELVKVRDRFRDTRAG
jgi:probable F420-dependent oxidoreductase